MKQDRHPFAVETAVTGATRAEDAVPAYCSAPLPAPVPAAAGDLSPLEQMFAYYDAL